MRVSRAAARSQSPRETATSAGAANGPASGVDNPSSAGSTRDAPPRDGAKAAVLSPDHDVQFPQPADDGARGFAVQCGHMVRIAAPDLVRAAQQACPDGVAFAPSAAGAFVAQQHEP